jgi:hypothetical protein
VKRVILTVMEHGLILALLVGSAAMMALGLLNLETWHGLTFLALGAIGFITSAGIVWARRMLTASTKTPESGGQS